MEIPGLNLVNHESSAREIMVAINLAGAYIAAANLHHRRYDRPQKEKFRTYSGFAWVKPQDIGPSSTRNTKLLEKLKRMVKAEILEIRYFGSLPRFRVKYSYRNPKHGRVRHKPDRTILGQH
jgi:hypothetical protein